MTGLTNQTLRREISGSKRHSPVSKEMADNAGCRPTGDCPSAGAFRKRALPCQRVGDDGLQIVKARLPSERGTDSVAGAICAGSTPAMLRGHIRFLRRLAAVELVGRLLNGCHVA